MAVTQFREKIVGPFSRYREMKRPIAKPTPKAIETELAMVGTAWQKYRSTNERDAVYIYLEAVYALVGRWQRLNCSLKHSQAALRLQADAPQMEPEPFGIVIFCTADPEIADSKTRSKWSRVLRLASNAKPADQRLSDSSNQTAVYTPVRVCSPESFNPSRHNTTTILARGGEPSTGR